MLPYDASLVTFNTSIRMVREGGNFAEYDVRAYGADPLGVSAATLAFRAAAAGVEANGGVFRMSSGAYKIAGKVSIAAGGVESYARITVAGDGRGATFIRPTVAPWLEIGSAVAGTRGMALRDFTVQLTSNLYWGAGCIRVLHCTEVHAQNVGLLSGTNLTVDAYAYTGYLFEFDSSFIVHLDRCDAIGRGVYLFELHSESIPTLQLDTFLLSNCLSEGMCVGVVKSAPSADFHNFVFDCCKHLMAASWPEANVSVETTLTSSPSAGATTFTVASASGLAAGQFMWVGQHLTPELVQISTIVSTTVTTSNPLRYAHTSGDQVLSGGFFASFGANVYNVEMFAPHGEFSAAIAVVWGTRHVTVYDAYGTVRDVIRLIGSGSSVKGLRVVRGAVSGNGGVNNVIRITTAGDDPGLMVSIDGPVLNPNTGSPPTTMLQNDAATNRAYRFTHTLQSGMPQTLANQAVASLALQIDQVTIAGATRFERDLAGGDYAWRRQAQRAGLTDGASVAVDASLADHFRLAAGGSRTILAPTNPPAAGRSQEITFEIFNNTGGAITTTWTGGGGGYRLAGSSWTDPAASKSRSITFRYEWSGNYWFEVGRTTADLL